MVAEVQGEVDVLLHDDDGHVAAEEAGEDFVERFDDQRRQAQGRLVEEQQLGLAHEGPPHGDHLLLAAGEGSGLLASPLLQPGQQVVDLVQPLGQAVPGGTVRQRPDPEVVLDGQRREHVSAFRHQSDPPLHPPVGRLVVDALPVPEDLALRRPHDPGQELEDGRLPRPVPADERHRAPGLNGEVEVADGGDGPVRPGHVAGFKHGAPPGRP